MQLTEKQLEELYDCIIYIHCVDSAIIFILFLIIVHNIDINRDLLKSIEKKLSKQDASNN